MRPKKTKKMLVPDLSRSFISAFSETSITRRNVVLYRAVSTLPDGLNSGGLQAAVASDERKPEVESSCCDDAVGHIWNEIS